MQVRPEKCNFAAKVGQEKCDKMKRTAYNSLLEWKLSPRRKPLIINGARQIGKTWLLRHFGEQEYDHLAYISCDNEPLAASLFTDYNTTRILRVIEAITKVPVLPHKTLIILDEIQEQPKGLSALKYFQENANEYHIAVAGSLLGIALHQGTSFPVGKVDMLKMYPMTFEEFLSAKNEDALAKAMQTGDYPTMESLHPKYVEQLRQYYYVGGMPEAVSAYIDGCSLMEVRDIQLNILNAYKNDISKHAPLREIQRINQVFRSIPAQLAKENKKFIYGAIKKGARAADFELAIQWLVDAGIVYKINRITNPTPPLSFYEDFNAFKLYLLDCGLYGAMNEVDAKDILIGDNVFSEFKGTFTEEYVLSQLMPLPHTPIYYYSADNSQLEIDFVLQHHGEVVPLEVKAEENLRSKSLKSFITKYNIPQSCRTSMKPYKEQERVTNVPLYAIGFYFSGR